MRFQRVRATLVIVVSVVSSISGFVTAQPAWAHCDDPHGAVEESACWAQSFPDCALNAGPGVLPSPDSILAHCSPPAIQTGE